MRVQVRGLLEVGRVPLPLAPEPQLVQPVQHSTFRQVVDRRAPHCAP